MRKFSLILMLAVFAFTSLFAESNLLDADVPLVYGEEQFVARIQAKTGGVREPVGLVLSGGSARAFAHIGVLKYLEEQGIVPDFIISNSMGSIIGMLYGAGLSPDQILELMTDTDIGGLFDLALPLNRGLIETDRFKSLVSSFLGKDLRVEDLPIPVMIVCEDLVTKQQIRICEGDFYEVLDASYALPVYFSSIPYDGHLLVDGGIANISPIGIAYDYGPCNMVSTTFYAGKNLNLNNPITALNTSIDVGKRRQGVIDLINHPDAVWIRCNVEEFSFMDFSAGPLLYERGYASALEQADKISALKTRAAVKGTGAHSDTSASTEALAAFTGASGSTNADAAFTGASDSTNADAAFTGATDELLALRAHFEDALCATHKEYAPFSHVKNRSVTFYPSISGSTKETALRRDSSVGAGFAFAAGNFKFDALAGAAIALSTDESYCKGLIGAEAAWFILPPLRLSAGFSWFPGESSQNAGSGSGNSAAAKGAWSSDGALTLRIPGTLPDGALSFTLGAEYTSDELFAATVSAAADANFGPVALNLAAGVRSASIISESSSLEKVGDIDNFTLFGDIVLSLVNRTFSRGIAEMLIVTNPRIGAFCTAEYAPGSTSISSAANGSSGNDSLSLTAGLELGTTVGLIGLRNIPFTLRGGWNFRGESVYASLHCKL